ncbi:HlyD family secretion protein [compost metagenome]
MISTSNEAGKVIDNFKTYVAVVMNSELAKATKVGKNVKIRLSNNTDVSGTVLYIVPENEDGNVVIVFKLDRLPEEFINYRKVTLDIIWWNDTGLKVPNQAIIQKDGLNYIVKNTAGYLTKLLVKIKTSNEKYSIVTTYSTDELKDLGFTTKDITSYKKITIYDEILMYPTIEQIQ